MKSVRGDGGRPDRPGEDETDPSRREVLTKIGRFAYAAPALALLAQPRSVQAYGKSTRPGWGYGDQNHVHTGPPGLNNGPPGLNK